MSLNFDPQGAVGIAGLVAAIYPVESPGGYQLFGRTLPTWQPWGKGPNFTPDKPWVLEPFDQVTRIVLLVYLRITLKYSGCIPPCPRKRISFCKSLCNVLQHLDLLTSYDSWNKISTVGHMSSRY